MGDNSFFVRGEGSRNNSIRRKRQFEFPDRNKALSNWSENILAEFNSFIAKEISELTKATEEPNTLGPKQRYRQLLNELGISNTDDSSTEDEKITKENEERKETETASCHKHMLNSDYDEPRDQIRSRRRLSGSLPENLEDTFDNTTSDYDEPSNCLGSRSISGMLHIKQNSSSLPGFNARFALPKNSSVEKHSNDNMPQTKPMTDPMPRSTRMLRAFARSKDGGEDPRAQLPPQPFFDSRRKASLTSNSLGFQRKRTTTNHYGKIQKLKSREANRIEPDYEEIYDPHQYEIIGRSKSLENNTARSAPSTPTEVKRTPFSRLLRRHKHTPIYRDSSAEAILVSVSSLPDQDFINPLNDSIMAIARISPVRDVESSRKVRAVSPLTLRSDITAKRLSESNKDVTQISPVELRRFNVGKSNGNDVAVSCNFPDAERSEVDGHVAVDYAATKARENGEVKSTEEQNSRSASVSKFCSVFKSPSFMYSN